MYWYIGTASDKDCGENDWIFCMQFVHGTTEGIYTKGDYTTNIYSDNGESTEWLSIAYVDTTGVFGLGMDGLATGDDPPLAQMVAAGTVNYNNWLIYFGMIYSQIYLIYINILYFS